MEGKVIKSLLSGVITQVYPVVAPQDITGSYVTYQIIDKVPWDSKGVVATVDAVRVTLKIVADTYSALATLVESVRTAMDQKSGTYASIVIQNVVFDDERDQYDEDLKKSYKEMDFLIIRNR